MTYIDKLNELSTWDYLVKGYDSATRTLVIQGSHDFTYGISLSITLTNVLHMDCPFRFSHAQFREITEQEQDALSKRLGNISKMNVKLCIQAQPPFHTSQDADFFILAGGIEVEEVDEK